MLKFTTHLPSGRYLLITKGIFFSLSSFIAICSHIQVKGKGKGGGEMQKRKEKESG